MLFGLVAMVELANPASALHLFSFVIRYWNFFFILFLQSLETDVPDSNFADGEEIVSWAGYAVPSYYCLLEIRQATCQICST